MRRRQRAALEPTWARPPKRLTRASMTEEDLTAELEDWSATLQPHEHPAAILERLRVFSVTACVPLDWAEQEQRALDEIQEHLRHLKALDSAQADMLAWL